MPKMKNRSAMNEELKLLDDKTTDLAGRDEEKGDPCEIPNFLFMKWDGDYCLYCRVYLVYFAWVWAFTYT